MGRAWIDVGIVLILLVVGGLFTSTELALVSLRVVPTRDCRVAERRMTDRADRAHDLVDAGEHRSAREIANARVVRAVDHDIDV